MLRRRTCSFREPSVMNKHSAIISCGARAKEETDAAEFSSASAD
jgi:hypothetical protein